MGSSDAAGRVVAAGTGEITPSNGRTVSIQRCLDASAARPGAGGMSSDLSPRVRETRSRRVEPRERDERQQGRDMVQ